MYYFCKFPPLYFTFVLYFTVFRFSEVHFSEEEQNKLFRAAKINISKKKTEQQICIPCQIYAILENPKSDSRDFRLILVLATACNPLKGTTDNTIERG